MSLSLKYNAIALLISLISYSRIATAIPVTHITLLSTNLSSLTPNKPLDSYLDLRVSDSLGSDISRQDAINLHHLIRTTHPTKRSPSYAINNCPTGRTFTASFCTPYNGDRTYQLYCSLQGPFSRPIETHPGSCAPNEYCVSANDKSRPLGMPFKYHYEAFCISKEDMVKFSSDQFRKLGQGRGGSFIVDTKTTMRKFGALIGELLHEAFGVVVEDAGSGAPMEGVSIQAVARGGAKQALEGGMVECTNCSNLTMYPLPAETQQVDLNVVIADSAKRAVIWVGSVALVSKLSDTAG